MCRMGIIKHPLVSSSFPYANITLVFTVPFTNIRSRATTILLFELSSITSHSLVVEASESTANFVVSRGFDEGIALRECPVLQSNIESARVGDGLSCDRSIEMGSGNSFNSLCQLAVECSTNGSHD